MGKIYRKSDFKNDTFYKKPQFYERLRIARLAGKETYFNEVRKINNSKEGRKYIGDISIQDIFLDNWDSFLNKYDTPDHPIRKSIKKNVDEFIKKLIIHIPEKGFQQIRYYGFYSDACYQKYLCDSKLFTSKDINELILRNTYKHGILWAFGYNPLLCQCGHEMIFAYEVSYYGGPT